MPWETLGVESEIVAIHAALLPTSPEGDILCFGDWAGSGPGGVVPLTLTRIFHVGPATMEALADEDLPDSNAFCGGQAFLADGRLLVAGGTLGWPEEHAGLHDPHYDGERASWIYLPREKRWVRARDLSFQAGSNSKGGGRWYPTLVSLASGEVIAIAGHPSDTDDFNNRHNNNTPERYAPASNSWTLLTADITAPNGVDTDSYPRFRLLPSGRLFCDTAGKENDRRLFDPYAGTWVTPAITSLNTLPGYYSRGSAATSVLLPLQPPAYRPRVLACNSPDNTAFRIDLDDTPDWVATAARQASMQGKNRENGCAVLLPTGQVLLCGGWRRDVDSDLANATLRPELYSTGIDWATGEFSGADQWLAVPAADEAKIGRGYHSVALLLPDGRVWTAGSTTASVGAEKRIEIFSPSYVGQTRPTISSAPSSIAYGQSFRVTVGNGNQIQRVALLRCGSITHGYDADQRYVGLSFSQEGTQLTVTAPPNGRLAPPGFYMLWVIAANDRPCQLARFVRLSSQAAQLYVDRSTFSVHEVSVTGTPATFLYSFYFLLDGFLPSEIGNPIPDPEVRFEYPGGQPVPGMSHEVAATKWENPALPPDLAQRLTFACHIRFNSMQAFNDITGSSDDIVLRVRHGNFSATANLVLSKDPNPWMRDGEVQWLSTDVRVFQIQPGGKVASVEHGSGANAPFQFIQALVAKFNQLSEAGEDHPFLNELKTGQQESKLTFAQEAGNGEPVFNYAVAKVRMKAPAEVTAADVGVFFRLFTTASTGFEYKPDAYARTGSGAGAHPVLGKVGGDIATIPFFAEARVAPGNPQPDGTNRTSITGKGNQEVHTYFGCWLDINQPTPTFEEDGIQKSIQEILKDEHQCLVAELDYALDPIPPNATPGGNDNLSQRNLVITPAPNPSGPATRVVAHTLEIAPSKIPAQLPANLGELVGSSSIAARFNPDELVFTWRNVPAATQATLYLPDVDIDQVLALAARRQGAPMLTRVDAHTLRLSVGGITYVPLPGGRGRNIPALLSLQLPPDLVKGTVYKATIKQFDGARRRVLGTVQLEIPITTAEEILPEEIRKLAVLRHIDSKLAPVNKWKPIFARYLGLIADRVRGFGVDPDTIEPSVTGNPSRPEHAPRPSRESFTGKVRELLYDCHGDFEGFVLESCEHRQRFSACEPAIEEVIRRACRERSTVTVVRGRVAGGGVLRIAVHCC